MAAAAAAAAAVAAAAAAATNSSYAGRRRSFNAIARLRARARARNDTGWHSLAHRLLLNKQNVALDSQAKISFLLEFLLLFCSLFSICTRIQMRVFRLRLKLFVNCAYVFYRYHFSFANNFFACLKASLTAICR